MLCSVPGKRGMSLQKKLLALAAWLTEPAVRGAKMHPPKLDPGVVLGCVHLPLILSHIKLASDGSK